MAHDDNSIKTVKDYWNRNINQVSFLKDYEIGTKPFFDESDRLRYQYHFYLLQLFDELAKKHPGGKLLEVGCSMGTDLLQLAQRGFRVTGIDLTENGIALAKKRFALYDAEAELLVNNAENLDFEDNTFDLVYSFGVIHHTENPGNAIKEVHRVLKDGGEAVIMLYNRTSLNYVAHRLLGIPADGTKKDPVPIAFTYSKSEIRELFSPFSKVDISVEYLFGTGWGVVNRLLPRFIHRFLGRIIGWHLVIRAEK